MALCCALGAHLSNVNLRLLNRSRRHLLQGAHPLHSASATALSLPKHHRTAIRIRSSEPAETSISNSIADEANPLEMLRTTSNMVERSRLLQRLDGCYTVWATRYVPSPIEQLMIVELGAAQHATMMLATMNPALSSYDIAEAKAAIRALKAANVDVDDVWALLSKRHYLLGLPVVLQRWLDFLQVYGLQPWDTVNFLLRAPSGMLEGCTLFQAGAVVSFLRSRLGLKDQFLAARVLCLWPERLGLEVTDIAGAVGQWPELLLASVEGRLKPLAAYLQDLGCSDVQVGEVLIRCPHLLGFEPTDVFTPLLLALANAGIDKANIRQMVVHGGPSFLTGRGGVQGQLDTLAGLGFTHTQRRALLLACPAVLVEKPLELERKVRFLSETGLADMAASMSLAASDVGGSSSTTAADCRSGPAGPGTVLAALACPRFMGASLAQVTGPRHGFATSHGLRVVPAIGGVGAASGLHGGSTASRSCQEDSSGTAQRASAMGVVFDGGSPAAPAASAVSGGSARVVPLMSLVEPLEDAAWALAMGFVGSDYAVYRAHWEEQYTDRTHREATDEFQEELRKLGIYGNGD